VTAAGQGIGRATAMLFAEEGAEVWATDVSKEKLSGLDQCHVQTLDVRNAASIDAIADSVGHFDILFNCAGYVANGSILECDEASWLLSFDLNVTAMFRLCKVVLPSMIKERQGSIINMASVASSIKGVPNRFAYSTTKAAIIGMTKSIAADYVQAGVRCNAICPGTVDTPSLQDRLQATGDFEAAHAAFVARQPMGRLGSPDEIAALALYLASDDSSFTTGQCHIIDGGWSN
jgi:2-keto-3-deoxy-L-fuconate dehydrogenase